MTKTSGAFSISEYISGELKSDVDDVGDVGDVDIDELGELDNGKNNKCLICSIIRFIILLMCNPDELQLLDGVFEWKFFLSLHNSSI